MESAIAIGLGAVALAVLAKAYWPLGGTTLRAPWCWAVVAIVAVTICEAVMPLNAVGLMAMARWRFAAAALTLCPAMALLGAKRPQDRAWQLIVLSGWVIVVLPAAQAWLLWPDIQLVAHPIWSWFLLVLILVGVGNHLPTRFWPSSLLVGAGQLLLLGQFLPAPEIGFAKHSSLAGLSCLTMAFVVACLTRSTIRDGEEPLSVAWRAFRDGYGAVWGLRVMDRVNATVAAAGARLTWRGIEPDTISPSQRAKLESALRPLLGRFVSSDWLDRRLAAAPGGAGFARKSRS